MADLQPRVVSIDADTMARVEAAVARTAAPAAPRLSWLGRARQALTGWMPPGQPVAIMVPVEAQTPRAWDYGVGINRHTTPRVEESVTPRELRFAAEDTLTRMAIETCKNRLERFGWEIKPQDPTQQYDPNDRQIIEIRDRLRRPDGRLTFQTWLRMVLEDRYVLDAASVYVRRNRKGTPFAFEVLDGATIRPLFDDTGRAPLEGPAYRQIIKGLPTVDLPAQDFVYAMRNPRPHKPYGFSETEQLLLTINIAIRRELAQLDYFTAGTVPDAIYAVDKDFGGETAIAKFQARWDSMFGDGARQDARRKLRFVPPGEMRELMGKPLQDEFDEWLARKIAYGFNLPPLWAVKVMNRATANQAEDSSLYEGMVPDMLWVKGLLDALIELGWGPEFGFFWQDIKTPDPEVQSRINATYVQAGILGIDEVRQDMGRPKIGARPMILTPAGPIPIGTLDPETGKPYRSEEGEAENADPTVPAASAGPVQDTALNGAQITSLLEITQKVSDGTLSADAGVAVILVSFPTIDETEAKRIVAGANPPPPPPVLPSLPDGDAPPRSGPLPPTEEDEADAPADEDDPAEPPKPLRRARTVGGLGKPSKRLLAGKAANSKAAGAQRKALAGIVLAALIATREAIAAQVTPLLVPLAALRAGGGLARRQSPKTAVDELDMAPIEAARAQVAASLEASATIGATAASGSLQVMVPGSDAFALDNAVVAAWAAQRAAELVGKRVLDDGTVVDNPNPRFAITASTRAMVRGTIVDALEQGLSREELVAALESNYAFSEARATLIARTEVSRAVIAGNILSWQESGLVTGKEWVLGSEHPEDDECDLNAAAGVIPVGDAFPSGDMEPPAHPGCVCDVLPQVAEGDA